MDWKIVNWKRVIWVGGVLLLLILFLALVKCNPDKPEPTVVEQARKQAQIERQKRELAETKAAVAIKEYLRCSAVNDSLAKEVVTNIDQKAEERETAIINEPIPNDKLIQQMSEFAKQHRVNR